ncbi:unnamed protein product [Clonostachys solani]|uniref:Fe2OG dioxygenase domain-containing protein n=1 Tax=Clonostachys solani TaxID=160281 RepID=A0A9P0EK96_9HYPO|nr:unnamed protein product [Clonostachys solani]
MVAQGSNSILRPPPLKRFQLSKPTKESLEWANLIELDISRFDESPQARKELASTLLESLHNTGFLFIVNHGVDETTLSYEIPKNGSTDGRYSGFAPQSYRSSTIYENNVEHYNFSRFTSEIGDQQNPDFPTSLRPYLRDVEAMSKYIHKDLARRLFILIAIALDVEHTTFADMHIYEAKSDSFMRYMQYLPRTHRENEASQDLYLPGHADWGSLTFLFNQPISALQIKDQNNEWKWVKYIPNSIVVNVGIALSALTGGYLKPTIHRVVKPPKDQADAPRLSLLYFIR